MSPFFSPDGKWIGFFTGNSLKKVAVDGGPSVTLCPTNSRLGATWGPDDTIVFASRSAPGLMRVPAAGGEPTLLTTPEPEEGRHNWPEFLPDGKAVLFTISKGRPISDKKIAVLSLESGETKILADGTGPRFAASGHLVFGREASLWAVPFDPAGLTVEGTPAPVVEGVQVNAGGGWALYDVAPDGSLAYLAGQGSLGHLVAIDREGVSTPLVDELRLYLEPRFSPDGRRIAVEADDDIWILDVARGTLSRLTVVGGADTPVWTPDGARVTYAASAGGGDRGIFWKPADGSGEAEQLASLEHRPLLGSWSPDGETLVFSVSHPSTGWDLWVLPRDGQPQPFLATPFRERKPELSPDGRWLLYLSDESGRIEVYLQPYPGPGQRIKVSTAGGTEPSWSRDGREIFYRDGARGDLMVVSFDAPAEPSVGQPRFLLEAGDLLVSTFGNRHYDISPDGRRFVTVSFSSRLGEIPVVLNWFEELQERVPTE